MQASTLKEILWLALPAPWNDGCHAHPGSEDDLEEEKDLCSSASGMTRLPRHVASPIWQKPFYITPTAKCKHINPQLASGVDEERRGKIKPREDVTQKMAQELAEREDFNFPNPSGYHLHHNMCKWLPLEFSSTTQPAKSQSVSLSRLAWLASYSGSHSFDRLNQICRPGWV